MAVADPLGVVTVFLGLFDPADPSGDDWQQYQAPATASLGTLADAIATDQGIATGNVSLMLMDKSRQAPVIEARATLLNASVIPNGARVILVVGS